MKVKDLIFLLEKCNQEQEVFIWDEGSRHPVSLVDELDDCVDLNIRVSENTLLDNAFPYALGYWQGRAWGTFENGTYENMSEYHRRLYKLGYDAGVADYSELDTIGT